MYEGSGGNGCDLALQVHVHQQLGLTPHVDIAGTQVLVGLVEHDATWPAIETEAAEETELATILPEVLLNTTAVCLHFL